MSRITVRSYLKLPVNCWTYSRKLRGNRLEVLRLLEQRPGASLRDSGLRVQGLGFMSSSRLITPFRVQGLGFGFLVLVSVLRFLNLGVWPYARPVDHNRPFQVHLDSSD